VVARASAVATTLVLGTAVRTHYEVLGVGASRGEIKVAYRRLARELHPDAAGCGDEGFIRLQCCTRLLCHACGSRRACAIRPLRRRAPRAGTGCGVPAEEVGDGLPTACFPAATIVVQMGQARWAGTRTVRKSPALARHDTEGFVPRAGPARLSGRAWAATSARRPNMATTRNWAGPMSARQF
jgi:hypothetical protein